MQYSLKDFTWNAENKNLSVEASSISFNKTWLDIEIISHITNKIVKFSYKKGQFSHSGDLMHWIYESVDPKITLIIFND